MSYEFGKYLSDPNKSPGEVIAEAAQGFRIAVRKGLISAEEADKKVNTVMRSLKILEAAGIAAGVPILFDTGSTQIEVLTGRRGG